MSETIVIIILFLFVGGLILWASFTGKSMAPRVTIVIGLYFIMIPVCIIFKWNKLLALMITVPLGLLWTGMALSMITQPFRYCVKREVIYRRAVFDHISKARHGRTKYYALECNLQAEGKEYPRKSEDAYTLRDINRKYVEGSRITVWVHKKKPLEFMVKRFHGMFASLCLLLLGVGFLWIAVKVFIEM